MLFFFWFPAKHKQEYFYMSAFALVSACFQVERFDLFHFSLSARWASALEVILLYAMPIFGLFAGLALIRAPRAWFAWGIPIGLGAPLPVAFLLPPGPIHELAKLISILYLVPAVGMAIGGMSLLQAVHLRRRSRGARGYSVRSRRLFLFALGNIALGLLYYFKMRAVVFEQERVFWLGFEHLGYMLFFVAIALAEYGEQEQIVSRTPVSEYHRRPVIPEAVSGVILVADLKHSEVLARTGASLGQGGKLVEACLTQLWNVVLREGGVILQTEGDALLALLDRDKVADPLEGALRAVDEMARRLSGLEAQFRNVGLEAAVSRGLAFRAGLAEGEIRAVWQEMGSSRHASWIEAGSASPLVEATRYMDLERSLPSGAGDPARRSALVLPESLAATAPGRAFAMRGLELKGKHAHAYRCAVWVAEAAPEAPAGEERLATVFPFRSRPAVQAEGQPAEVAGSSERLRTPKRAA